MADDLDMIAELQDELFWKDSGWIKTPPNEKGEFAIYPETAPDVDAWEKSNMALHERQMREGPIMPPEKPSENMLLRDKRLRRGD